MRLRCRSMAYFLRVLGRFELVSPSGETITISSRKNQALIAILALADGEPVLRSKLCDLLWQDRGEAQARNSLRQALTALRKSFAAHGDFPLVITEEDAAIDGKLLETDLKQSKEEAAGEFLEGLSIPGQAVQDWLLGERQRISAQIADGLSKRMAELAEGGDDAGLISTANALLASDPLNEAAHRALMRAYTRTGDRNKGLKQFQLCRDLLKAELGVEPDAVTRLLCEQMRGGAVIQDVPPDDCRPDVKTSSSTSDRPAITIKPFEDLSDNQDQPQFANALTRELVTELGHFPNMVVRAVTMDAPQTGSARHYTLEGSVQMSANRVRVTAQLNELSSGNQVWGKRYDAETGDSLELQDELARQIAGNLYQPLMNHATRRAREEPGEGSDQHKLYLQAYHHIERPTAAGIREAQSLLEKVLEIDPGYAIVYEGLAWGNFHSCFNGWLKDPWQGLQAARRDAARGLSLDDRNSYLRSAFGLAEAYLGNTRRGVMELHEAVSLSPGDAEMHTFLGIGLTWAGELDDALAAFAEADRLSPNYHPIFLFRGDALYAGGQPRDALENYDQFLTILPEYNWAVVGKAACHVECGEFDEARESVAIIRRQSPFMTCDYLQSLLQTWDQAIVGRMLAALEQAGLPGASKPDHVAPAESDEPASLTSNFPGIAVLPFENLSGDPEQAYFADGLTEDITTALSRFKQLLIIASSSAFSFKGQGLPASEIASQLGVRYIVEGSVRRAAGRVRVTVQLVDGETGNQMWSERYDRILEDIFAVQDDIANSIVGTVHGRVRATNARRVTQLSSGELEAYDWLLRAWALVNRYTKSDNAQAIDLVKKALDLEPDNATALAEKAVMHWLNWMAFWVHDRQAEIDEAARLARKAVDLEPGDSYAQWVLGEILQMTRNYDEAHRHLTRAVDLNPNDIAARGILGFYYSAIGEPELALREYQEVRRRDPMELNWTPWLRGIAYFTARNYGEAIATFREVSLPINEIHFWLAISYAHNGEMKTAGDELQTFLDNAKIDMADFPGEQPDDWRDYAFAASAYRDAENIDHLIGGLRKAGMGG